MIRPPSKRSRALSVRTKFTLVLLLVALGPLALLTLVNNYQAHDRLLKSTEAQLSGHARLQAGTIDSLLTTHLHNADVLAAIPGLAAYLATPADRRPDAVPGVFSSAQAVADSQDSAALFMDTSGLIVLATDPRANNLNVGFRPYFKQALAGVTNVESPVISQSTGLYSFYFASPVKDVTGKIVGVAVLRTPESEVQNLLGADANVLGPGSYGMLLDESGVRLANGLNPALNNTAIAHLSPDVEKQAVEQEKRFGDPKTGFPVNAAPDLARLVGTLKAPGATAVAGILPTAVSQARSEGAAVRLHNANWTYIELEPEAAFLAGPNAELHNTELWLGIIAILVTLVSVVFARNFTEPIGAIGAYLRRIREGDYASRLRVRSRDEFGRLADDVNATVDRLTQLVLTSEQKDAMQGQIEKLLDEVAAVGEGDLRVEAEVTAGTLGSLADSFNYMIEELRRIIGAVQQTTMEVTDSARQLRVSSELLAAGSAHQSTQIAETSEAIRHMDVSIQQVAEDANVSRQVADEALNNAQRGGEAVAKTIASMNRIRVNVQDTAKKVKQLGESSQEIGNIVKLIEDISDKTDLLALNAAIQAELAGEHGRGFAVLADEVRRLAERATASTKQIATLVKSIQSETQEAVTAMEESTREVVSGSQLADEAGQALLSIDHVLTQLAERIASISGATAEQAGASAQIAETMRDISNVTVQTHESTREAAEKVSYLDQVASHLRTSVAAFKLPEGQGA